jgi:hypothetical protein
VKVTTTTASDGPRLLDLDGHAKLITDPLTDIVAYAPRYLGVSKAFLGWRVGHGG